MTMHFPIPQQPDGRNGRQQSIILCVLAFLSALALTGASDSCETATSSLASEASPGAALLQVQNLREKSATSFIGKSVAGVSSMEGLDGLLAPLNEAGYANVAGLRSPPQMDQFVRRTVNSMGLQVIKAEGLQRLVPRYSGNMGTPRSFSMLQSEILEAFKDAHGSWVGHTAARSQADFWQLKPISATDFMLKSANMPQKPVPNMQRKPVASTLKKSVQKTGYHTPISLMDGEAVQGKNHMVKGTMAGQDTGLGTQAPLDETGYSEVLQLKNNNEMEVFMRRTVEDLGLHIASDAGFKSTVPWFSGEAGYSSFGTFKGKILNMLGQPGAWVVDPHAPKAASLLSTQLDVDATLSEEGMSAVVEMRSNPEMVSYIQRLVESMGLKVTNRGGPEGLAPFFSGDKQVGTLLGLKSEIFKAVQTTGSWVTKK